MPTCAFFRCRNAMTGEDVEDKWRVSWLVPCVMGSLPGLMSCKSRAEAFARHLQTKLRSLGGLIADDDTNGNPVEPTTDSVEITHIKMRQDEAQTISDDEQLYYEFGSGSSSGSPSSPDTSSKAAITQPFPVSVKVNNYLLSDTATESETTETNVTLESTSEDPDSACYAEGEHDIKTYVLEQGQSNCSSESREEKNNKYSSNDFVTLSITAIKLNDDHHPDESINEQQSLNENENNLTQDKTEKVLSPVWGSSKRIDRFQVRKEKDSEEKEKKEKEEKDEIEEKEIILDETKEKEIILDETKEKEIILDETKEKEIILDETKEKEIILDETKEKELILDEMPVTETISPSENRKNYFFGEDYVDDPTEDVRPKHIYRSSSLKTGKTPPGTPGRKKIVRFADVLGLDLEDIKHVCLDDLPTVPKSAYSDLDESAVIQPNNIFMASFTKPQTNLVAMFTQPYISTNFLDRVRTQKVCLESAESFEGAIKGLVRVINMAFTKKVIVRYTTNEWRTFVELETNYLVGSNDSLTDRFSFVIYGGDKLNLGQRIIFCIRYESLDQEYWDNNNGHNYQFQCIQDCPNQSVNMSLGLVDDDRTSFLF